MSSSKKDSSNHNFEKFRAKKFRKINRIFKVKLSISLDELILHALDDFDVVELSSRKIMLSIRKPPAEEDDQNNDFFIEVKSENE